MSLVNRDEQEKIMTELEQIFSKYDLMPDEKLFVLNAIVERIRKGQEKQKMTDLMSQSMSGGLLKNIQKKFFEGDKDG